MWSTRHFFNPQSGVIAYTNNYGRNGNILQYKMFGEYCHWTFCTVFKDKLIFVRYMKQSLTLVFGTVFIGWNQLQIFDNDNFSIIPKSIFSDNDNLPISCKNADLSAFDNFFDNIDHPYPFPTIVDDGIFCKTIRTDVFEVHWPVQLCAVCDVSFKSRVGYSSSIHVV